MKDQFFQIMGHPAVSSPPPFFDYNKRHNFKLGSNNYSPTQVS